MILDSIREAVISLKYDEIEGLCKEALLTESPIEIIRAMSAGMEEVGKKYEAGEYFLPELIVAGEIVKRGMTIVEPHLNSSVFRERQKGAVVIGTVRGDIHDIGKNIFGMLAKSVGFEVVDLGTDVSPERFVKALKEKRAEVVGMSCLITTSMPEMKKVIDELKSAGLRSQVKVMLGGAPITGEFGRQVGADAAVNDAVKGIEILKRWF